MQGDYCYYYDVCLFAYLGEGNDDGGGSGRNVQLMICMATAVAKPFG